MVAVTQINDKYIHINALFIQPTTYCARNCKGCYVKGFENILGSENSDSPEMLSVVEKLLDMNREGIKFKANQITMAVDTLELSSGTRRPQRLKLSDFFSAFNIAAENKESTEFHITVHSVRDLMEYLSYLTKGIKDIYFDLVSISILTIEDIPWLESTKSRASFKVNWNYQPWGPVDRQIELIKAVLPHVESMYFILHKPDLGLNLDKNLTDTYFEVLQRMRAELPRELMRKVNIDGCVLDAKKYVDTEYGCSSNISRFQIWPNGAVSGCPYTHRPTTGPANTIDEVFNNIREAYKYYEFNKCLIPDNLHSSHPTILKKNKHLIILED